MLKGCQREMIVLQTQDSVFFESAYFVLRREKHTVPKIDLLAEANRIIGSGSDYFKRRTPQSRRGLFFALGCLAGGGLSLLLCLLIL
ncbi:MAG: hypothetical protein IKD28_00750 [Clostridia bacterium]|nr:hypothetical protein [Clostridia bacterium]